MGLKDQDLCKLIEDIRRVAGAAEAELLRHEIEMMPEKSELDLFTLEMLLDPGSGFTEWAGTIRALRNVGRAGTCMNIQQLQEENNNSIKALRKEYNSHIETLRKIVAGTTSGSIEAKIASEALAWALDDAQEIAKLCDEELKEQ